MDEEVNDSDNEDCLLKEIPAEFDGGDNTLPDLPPSDVTASNNGIVKEAGEMETVDNGHRWSSKRFQRV